MLVVETIAKIRRAYFVQGKAIEAICRELNVSRKVVRKVLRSGGTEFVYERTVQPQPKIGPWRDDLDRLLAVNAARSSRERMTLIRVFEDLRGLVKLETKGRPATNTLFLAWRQHAVESARFVAVRDALRR